MSGQGRPLGQSAEPVEPVSGMRVVLDARPLQEPDRAPATAAYLGALLGAFDAEPLAGESFAFFLQSDLDDPTTSYDQLAVVGRRLLPPTRLLRSAAMTVDPFLLRGAALGAAWRAERGGAGGAVYHAAGGSTLPLASGLPVVVTLLDLAPWELAGAFQRTPATRFGQRIRGRLLRDADAVIVGSDAVGAAARRLLHLRRDRIRVIPFAPRDAFTLDGPDGSAERERLGLPERYLVYAGRYDARQDLATLLRALAELAAAGRPPSLPEEDPWPPRILLVGASPDDRAALARPRRASTLAMRWPTRRTCPTRGSRPSSEARGPRSSPRCRRRPALPRSTHSRAGHRSSLQRSARSRSSSAARILVPAPRTGTARGRLRWPAPTDGCTRGPRRGARAGRRRRTWPRSPPRPAGLRGGRRLPLTRFPATWRRRGIFFDAGFALQA